MANTIRRVLTARVPYSNTHLTVRVYALLWGVFMVGMSAVGIIQVMTGVLPSVGDMIGRYGPSLLGATIGFVLLSAVNIAVNRRRDRRWRAPAEARSRREQLRISHPRDLGSYSGLGDCGAGPVLERVMSSGVRSTVWWWGVGSSISDRTSCTAMRPISLKGWRMVVSGGQA